MKLVVEKLPDLSALHTRHLRLLLSAEEVIAIKLPHFRESATDPDLIEYFHQAIQASNSHSATLRELLSESKEDLSPLKSKVTYAFFDESDEFIDAAAHPSVRDVALVAAAQRLTHFQMAAYGSVRQFAAALGHNQEVQLYDEILRMEGHLSRHLAGIAALKVNPAAVDTDNQRSIQEFPGGPMKVK